MATILQAQRADYRRPRGPLGNPVSPLGAKAATTYGSGQQQNEPARAGQQPTQGRRYVNLQEWAGLNREQGQAAAKGIGDRVEGQAQAASDAQAKSRDEFTGGVKAGSVSFDPNVRSSSVAKTMGGQSYSGPTQLSQTNSYADATQKTNTAARDLGRSDRELQLQQYGQGQYGVGEQNYDAALLRGGADRMQQLRDKYSGLADQWNRSQTDASAIAGQAATDSTAAANAYRDAAPRLEQEEIDNERKASEAAADQWLRDQSASATVQRAWIEAGRPALGPWLQQNAPELYKKYSGSTGKTGSTGGLKSTPNKTAPSTVELN